MEYLEIMVFVECILTIKPERDLDALSEECISKWKMQLLYYLGSFSQRKYWPMDPGFFRVLKNIWTMLLIRSKI
jgi:hypothetical protein